MSCYRHMHCILYINWHMHMCTLTTYFIFSHLCLYTNSGRFWIFDYRVLLHISDCQTATRETQTAIYLVSSANVTVARKSIETGEWHMRSLWSSNKACVTGAGSRGMLELKQATDPRSQRESRRSARFWSWNMWTLSVSMINKCVWEKTMIIRQIQGAGQGGPDPPPPFFRPSKISIYT